MSETIEGTCHCGKVTVRVPASAFGVIACHCGDCQKLHGNYFAMLAVDRGDVTWKGEASIRTYASSPKAKRTFCEHCGSRLAKDPVGSPKLLISVGLFERTLPKRIVKQVFAEAKPDWYDLPKDSVPSP